eukprot:CAMPEP_0119430174 /NCGR_PEP_ID=MMETSP1335-20130426/43590_1 /TAXON_ID=259385 /ORGANISM="Chrysoculter rhomboideus, Strain RCC1486" /LENGTH=304 /DNA_ID=CAMNT_0007455925 /DNA_START=1 /DNA_END=911 /DNA_ORIENTATION=+
MEWVIEQDALRPAVVSMSLGGGFSHSTNLAVERLHAAGIVTVVAAGNDAVDACTQSPSSAPTAITVGATEQGDRVAAYSSFGACVDIWAPGTSIYSAVPSWGNRRYRYMTGTSMACPHVAGVAAQVLQLDPRATPAQVVARLQSAAVRGALGSRAEPSDYLLQVVSTHTAPPSPPALPPGPLPCPYEVEVAIVPDQYSWDEQSWAVTSADGAVLHSGSDEGGVFCVDGGRTYTFTIYDEYGDGGALRRAPLAACRALPPGPEPVVPACGPCDGACLSLTRSLTRCVALRCCARTHTAAATAAAG